MSGPDDKRSSDREPVTLFVEYEGADDLVGDYTENLSTGGTFVATNRELPIGTRDPNTVSLLLRVRVVEDNKHVAQLIHDGLKGSARREFGGGVTFAVRN